MDRVHGVDRIRAFAALSVLLAHLVGPHLPGLLKYTFTGAPAVIAFFVISGFCIHYPYVKRTLPIGAFLISRLVRIMLPVSVAMVAAQSIGIWQYNLVDGYILWSVVCELWYYALYPLFLALSRFVSWRIQWVIALAVSYTLVGMLGSDQYGNVHKYGPMLNWLVLLPSWLLGCVIAEGLRGAPRPGKVWAWRAGTALTASLLYWLTLNTPLGYYLTMNVFALLVAGWLLAEVAKGGHNTFDWIGKWSFSIYLFHAVVARAAGSLGPIPSVAISLALCYVAYLMIERPSHILARRVYTARSTSPARS